MENEPQQAQADPQSDMEATEFDVRIALFGNALILRQLALAFGIPIILLVIFMAILEWPLDGDDALMLLKLFAIVGGIILCLLLIAIGVVYGGHYGYHYVIDNRGVTGCPLKRIRKINRIVSLLLIFSGKPGPMGAGMLAASRERESVTWKRVVSVKGDPKERTVSLMGKRRRLMVLMGDDAQYEDILRCVESGLARFREPSTVPEPSLAGE